MSRRLDLHRELQGVLGTDKVYFQPPPNVEMSYPCIVYYKQDIRPIRADNIAYLVTTRYQIIVMYQDPDSDLSEKIACLPGADFARHYVSNNIYHDVVYLHR